MSKDFDSNWLMRFQAQEMVRKTSNNAARHVVGDERETGSTGVQKKIQNWCDAQWPRWLTIVARTDKRSTIGEGVQDFTIFGPHPLCICVETKSRTGKLSDAQRNWAHEMSRLGWTVHLVRSLEEFLAIAKPQTVTP